MVRAATSNGPSGRPRGFQYWKPSESEVRRLAASVGLPFSEYLQIDVGIACDEYASQKIAIADFQPVALRRKQIESVLRHAKRLNRSLSQLTHREALMVAIATGQRLESLRAPIQHELAKLIGCLEETSDRQPAHKGGRPQETALALCLFRLEAAYQRATGKKPSIGRGAGHFVDFVDAFLSLVDPDFHAQCTPDSIAGAIRRLRKKRRNPKIFVGV